MRSDFENLGAIVNQRPYRRLGDKAPIDRLIRPLSTFLGIEAISGIFLLLCALAALIIANSPLEHDYHELLHKEVGFNFGEYSFHLSFLHWINDGLMTIFFFVVGLEIKREIVIGELRDWRTALLPVMAAIGGMIAPALVYLLFQQGTPAARGWGIPTATDIAFVVGVLAVLGKRVPLGLKLFLLSLAIADDLGAVIVIALFYSQGIDPNGLYIAASGMVVVFFFQRLGVWSIPPYIIAGIVIWLGMLQSGVHPTIGGVILGFATPILGRTHPKRPFQFVAEELDNLPPDEESEHNEVLQMKLRRLYHLTSLTLSPLERIEQSLHGWVAFLIMPLFAVTNAAVTFDLSSLGNSVSWSIVAGLVIGKPLGIVLFTFLAVITRLGKLPRGVNWKTMVGGGCLGGIGFTMSLFVASLSFKDAEMLSSAKIGIFLGSLLSAVIGVLILSYALPKTSFPATEE